MNSLTDRIVVIGASGQLGSDVLRIFADRRPNGVDHAQIDIESGSAVAAMLARFKPTLVINTAAYHNFERCETFADRAFAVNAIAVEQLATQCDNAGAALMHVSTDYVFDGKAGRAYRESDAPNPLSVYGVSKYAGELLVRRRTERHFIVRTSGLYGRRGSSVKGMTFVERMLSMALDRKPISVVDDVTFSPSYTVHVATAIRAIAESGAFGTYHVTNAGACTWYEFATEIFRQAGLEPAVTAVASDAFPSYAIRPAFSALEHASLKAAGLPSMPDWREGIAAYLDERGGLPTRVPLEARSANS
jgi:dTDP-4-dehydrorhamnose reductase